MSDQPRQTLSDLIRQFGRNLGDDPKRCEAMLKDSLKNGFKREINALVAAAREGIPAELTNVSAGIPVEPLTVKLARQLHDETGLDLGLADWSVRAWALALDVPVTVRTSPANVAGATSPSAGLSGGWASVSPSGFDLAARVRATSQQTTSTHQEARRLVDEEQNFAAAADLLVGLPGHLRDQAFYSDVCRKRDRVIELEKQIAAKVHADRFDGLSLLVQEFLTLQPRRDDMRELLAALPLTESEIVNSIGLKLKRIPAGEFDMGSPRSETDRQDDEGPVHRVRISRPFYLGVFPVTQGEYRAVMGYNPSHFASVSGLDTKRFPVENVTWFDAVEFCNKLSVKENRTPCYRLSSVQRDGDHITSASVKMLTGNGYRLPTEAEWEYACRAGTKTPFHFGSVLNGAEANVNGNYPYGTSTKGKYLKRTTTVGSYPANAFGLFDMHGNVWEWCEDVYDSSAYSKRSGLTTDPRVTSGSEDRVLRGGSWYNFSWVARAANRVRNPPVNRNYFFGFRVCRP